MARSPHGIDRARAAEIYAPIQDRLVKVEDRLGSLTDVHFPFLSELLAHVYGSTGKRTRPAITLLASSFHDHDEFKSEVMATAVELLHIATLIHDDTVDESDVRRGRATISSLFGGDIAVLVGDYVFASSATFVCDTGHVGVIKRFSETIMELSIGELNERISAHRPTQTLDAYYGRIYNKTASLFRTAGETGAILSGAPDDHVDALRSYSRELGMAFQIVDDILDFEADEAEIGKPVGSDLANGIMTLPAFIATKQYPVNNPIMAYLHDAENSPSLLDEALELIRQPEIIAAAYDEASTRCEAAKKASPHSPRRHPATPWRTCSTT